MECEGFRWYMILIPIGAVAVGWFIAFITDPNR